MNSTMKEFKWLESAKNIGQEEFNVFKVDLGIVIHKCNEMIHTLLDAIPNIVIGIMMLTVCLLLSKLVRRFIKRHVTMHKSVGLVLERLCQFIFALFGILVAMAIIFPSVKPIDVLGGLGVVSLAVGFAIKDIINNFLSGMLILLQQPFKVGDEIKYKDMEGIVDYINIRYTVMTGFDGRKFFIPNGEIYSNLLIVNTGGKYRWTNIEIRLDFRHDIENIKFTLQEAIANVPGVLQDPKPSVATSHVHANSMIINCAWATLPYQKIISEVKNEVLKSMTHILEMINEQQTNQAKENGNRPLNYKIKREAFS